MESLRDNICAVCCLQFSKRAKVKKKKSDSDDLFHLHKIHQSLTDSTSHNDGRSQATRNTSSSEEVPKYYESVICPDCIFIMGSTLEKKDLLNGLEVKVRKLQLQILKLLDGLQNKAKDFSKEMDKLESIVEESREKVNHLDEFYLMKMDHDERLGSTPLKDAIQFRERIFSVINKLCTFNKEVTEFNGKSSSTDTIHGDTRDYSDFLTISSDKAAMPAATRKNRKTPSIPPKAQRQDKNKDKHLDNIINQYLKMEEEAVLLSDNSNSGDGHPSYSESQTDQNLDEISDAEDVDDNDVDYVPFSETSSRKKNKRKKVKRNQNPPDHQVDCSGETSNDDEDSYRPDSQSNSKMPSREEQAKRKHVESILSKINFSGMTPFKKNLITQFVTKTERLKYETKVGKSSSEAASKCPQFDDIDPMKTHLITYDQNTDTINLCNFRVTINQVDESAECLNCGASFKSEKNFSQKVKMFMYNHILGQHLQLFNCPHCPSKLSSYRTFKTHILGHLNMYVCDICGRPLKGQEALKLHRYLHMSQEERKAEAAKEPDGMDRLEKLSQLALKRKLEKKYQCTTCGRKFATSNQLKSHDESHQNKREHMCPNCGKAFNYRSTLQAHLKYFCIQENNSKETVCRFKCDHCGKKFPLQSILRQHVLRMHTELDRNFKCDLCGKSFKLKTDLKVHAKTHSDVRAFVCGNGCGASYKRKDHCRRHENTCNGLGKYLQNN